MVLIDHEVVKDTKLASEVSYFLHKKKKKKRYNACWAFCHIFKALILNEVRELQLVRRARNIGVNI